MSSENRRIVILSTDTAHHRYFINRVVAAGIPLAGCIFETTGVQPPFPVGPCFEEAQDQFESAMFFRETPRTLDGVRIEHVANINGADAVAAITAMTPALGVVFGTRRLAPATIARFGDGLLNIHRGMPQDYRGLDSDLWAVYHRDWDGIGATVHFVEASLDTGPIVSQQRLRLTREMRYHQVRFHTTVSATDMMIGALRDYMAGRLATTPQDRVGRYYSFMPLVLRRLVVERFDRHCETLDG